MFDLYKVDNAAKRRLAEKILNAVGLHPLVKALPELVYSFSSKMNVVNDDWFWDALFRTGQPLLDSTEKDGVIYLYRPNNPEVKIPLPEKSKPEARKPVLRQTTTHFRTSTVNFRNLTFIQQKILETENAFYKSFGQTLRPETLREHTRYHLGRST